MSEPTKPCGVCQTPATLKCANCHLVSYCGKKHQKDDWPKHKVSCRAYEIRICPVFSGRYVVAARDIKKGDVIVNETPLAIGPNHFSAAPESCPGCFDRLFPKESRVRCPQCEWPICKSQCPGLTDSTRHGAECSILSKIKEATIFHSLESILPLRCLLLQKTYPKKWHILEGFGRYATTVSRTTKSRETQVHFEEAILTPLKKIVPNLLPDCSNRNVKLIFSVLDAYGHVYRLPHSGSLVGVGAVTSSMEHSCLPNSRRTLDISSKRSSKPLQCRIVVRATRDISKGERISTAFIDILMCTFGRQHSLIGCRGIYCRCRRCLDPRELGTDFGTMKCTSCGGWVLPVDTANFLQTGWKCTGKCEKLYSNEVIQSTALQLQKEMEAVRISEQEPSISDLEKQISQLHKFLHPNHNFCMLAKKRLYNRLGSSIEAIKGLSDAELGRCAELCQDVFNVMKHPCLRSQESFAAESLQVLAFLKAEIATRKKQSGAWNSARCIEAIRETEALNKLASEMNAAQFDSSPAEF